MSPFGRAAVAVIATLGFGALLALGCDTLFPEFYGSGHDAATAGDGAAPDDGGTAPELAGTVCVLSDLRDYRSCGSASTGVLRVTVEETRQQTMTDVAGHFVLPLSSALTAATVAVVDPQGNFATTVVPVRLSAGVAANLALPVVAAQTLSNAALQNGVALDPQRGMVLAWVVDPTGAPVAGAAPNVSSALVDGAGANELDPGTATHARGTVALFDVAPTTLMLTVTPPASLPLQADTFTLPIRGGALTASTLVLPPR